MALIPCRECGAQISDAAEVCPHCGIRLAKIASPVATRPLYKHLGWGSFIFIAAVVLGIIVAALPPEKQLTPEEKTDKVAEDKRIEESNRERSEALQSATFAAMLFDPNLKYEFGIFHALDLTLSSLNAALASTIANKLCSTYHLSGSLRVFLADGHLAAQCDFPPAIKSTTAPVFVQSPQCTAEEQTTNAGVGNMIRNQYAAPAQLDAYVDAHTSKGCKDAKAAHVIAWKKWYDQTTAEQREAQAANTGRTCSSAWPIVCAHGF